MAAPVSSLAGLNATGRPTLRDKQQSSLLRMLSFNTERDNKGGLGSYGNSSTNVDSDWADQWKLLIYDRYCRDVISPLLKVGDLRKQGVTLHMLLDADREEVPDVPAIYFVKPTDENLARISKDLASRLYTAFHLNFVSPLPRNHLESLARQVVESETNHLVAKVFDQYLSFVTLESNLFTLNQSHSYLAYNNPKARDTEIEASMDAIAGGLFSVLATLGDIPVIRCAAGGPGELVARKLHDALRDHLVGRSELFSGSFGASGFQRPVLIILDRNDDIASALHHPSTYQALVDDLIGINMNRVSVTVTSSGSIPGGSKQKRTYDLDCSSDPFFKAHAGDLFPEAISANEEEMKQVTRKEEEIRAKAGGQGDFLSTGESTSTRDLVSAVDTLPALLEKKRQLEVHTNIFQAAFEIVATRHVPTFSMLEQKILNSSVGDKAEILELLADPEKGTFNDKLRLLLVYYLASSASSADLNEAEEAIKSYVQSRAAAGHTETADFRALKYLRKHSAFRRKPGAFAGDIGGNFQQSTGDSSALLKGLAGAFSSQAQGWLERATASVKNFLPSSKKLNATRVADNICELKPGTEDETWLYLDPKIKPTASGEVPRLRTLFREAIVFVIGGGNYTEYQNLQDYCKAQLQPRNILYGCTELLSAEAFVEQLSMLGSDSS